MRFSFEPRSFKIGAIVSLGTIALLLVGSILAVKPAMVVVSSDLWGRERF